MKNQTICEPSKLQGKNRRLIELRDKISKVNKTSKANDEVKLQQIYEKVKDDERTLSSLFDAITQKKIIMILERASRKIEQIQEYLFNELDAIKNKQLDTIKDDIENHIKYGRRIKRMMMMGATKSSRKNIKQFSINSVVKKLQQLNPECSKIDKEIQNLSKIMEDFLELKTQQLYHGNYMKWNGLDQKPYLQLDFSAKHHIGQFQQLSEYRKNSDFKMKSTNKNEDFDLLLPTANKNEEIQEISFPSNHNQQRNRINNEQDFSLHIKCTSGQNNEIRYFGSEECLDSGELFGHQEQKKEELMDRKRPALFRVKSSEMLMESGKLKKKKLLQEMKSQCSIELSRSMKQSETRERRSNPLESLKQQQQRYNELKKKLKPK